MTRLWYVCSYMCIPVCGCMYVCVCVYVCVREREGERRERARREELNTSMNYRDLLLEKNQVVVNNRI